MDRKTAFVICSKYTGDKMLFDNIKKIQEFHSESTIILVDSDSDNKEYLEEVSELGVIVEDVQNKRYEAGAWVYAFDKYEAEFDIFVFLQDTMVLKKPLDLSQVGECDTCGFLKRQVLTFDGESKTYGWCNDSRNWAKGVGEPLWDDKNIILYNTFIIASDLMREVLHSEEFSKWPPPKDKKGSKGWERVWNHLFKQNKIKEVPLKGAIEKKFLRRN